MIFKILYEVNENFVVGLCRRGCSFRDKSWKRGGVLGLEESI